MRGLHKAARGGAFPAACQAAAAPSSAGLEAGRAGGRPARGSSAAPRMEPPVPPPQEPPPRPRSHTVTTTSSSFTANLSASSSTLAYDREFLRTLPGLLMVTEIVSVPREAAAMEERAGGGARRGGGAAARPRALSSGFRVAAEEGSRCCLEVGLFPLGSSSPDAASRGPYRQVKRREKAWKQRPGPGGGHSTPASKLSTAAKVIQGTCGLFSLPQRLRYHHLL